MMFLSFVQYEFSRRVNIPIEGLFKNIEEQRYNRKRKGRKSNPAFMYFETK